MRCFWHTYEMFLAYLYLFLFLGGEFIFDWLELMELFRLYLGASLCILSFLLLPHCFYLVWVIHVRGSIFCVSCFKLFIDL